ncbi:MAG: InlB B-repeat-containing protein, partial [Treponema sp.]|nr:InlB B-repeat-containing protein [Treponema sp.]
ASYTVESQTITLAAPARAGYTFGGWYGNANLTGSAVASIPQKSTGDKSFWAKWTPASYTITYNLDGGSLPEEAVSSYIFGTALTLPEPTKTNYSFTGWFDTADFSGEQVSTIAAGAAGAKSFWAKWTPVYSVIYNANGGSGSVASSIHALNEENVLAANGFTRPGYVFAGWNTHPYRGVSTTLYRAGSGVSDLASSAGEVITLYARWLPVEQTIELADPPTRGWGHNAAGALLWQFFPERKEFVVFAGQDYKSKIDSTVYVTGRTTENRIRVLPGRSMNTWAEVPDYSISQAYSYIQWEGIPDSRGEVPAGEAVPGYVEGQIIPRPVLLGQIYNAHQIRIVFVNAEIEIPSVQGENSRSPLDIGPYHTFWKDGSWEGDFYQSLGWDLLNDHEIDAVVDCEGENKLYTPSSPGIALWDSRAQGYAYVNEIPWQPHSNSWTSWKTKNNLPHWKEYARKCVNFAKKWGYPYDYSPQDGSIENGPGVVGHRFQSFGWGPSVLEVAFRGGGSLDASDDANGVVELSGLFEIIPANGNAWTRRTTTK